MSAYFSSILPKEDQLCILTLEQILRVEVITTEDPPRVGLELEDLLSPFVNFTIFLEEKVYWLIEEIRNSIQSPSELSFED